MAKLFVAVFPGSECDRLTKHAGEFAGLFDCKFNCKPMPEERDANYYEICFGENEDMAKVAFDFVRGGPHGHMNAFADNSITLSVYGLYRAEILSDDVTLEQFIYKEAG